MSRVTGVSSTGSPYGIPMPGEAGVEDFLVVTLTGTAMYVSTTLGGEELVDLLDQIAEGIESGAEFERYLPVRPS